MAFGNTVFRMSIPISAARKNSNFLPRMESAARPGAVFSALFPMRGNIFLGRFGGIVFALRHLGREKTCPDMKKRNDAPLFSDHLFDRLKTAFGNTFFVLAALPCKALSGPYFDKIERGEIAWTQEVVSVPTPNEVPCISLPTRCECGKSPNAPLSVFQLRSEFLTLFVS